jgi:PAT family acetyl-CoA transporter-like MFS transporter 1
MKRSNTSPVSDYNQIKADDVNQKTTDAVSPAHQQLGVKQGIRKDLFNIVFLAFLYLLQCVPLGLSGSLPYILSSRKVSYSDQGTFSLAFWPFSLKLLW